ncbi:MAG: cysteine-rich CWC family protein [Gemmatimonadales bacterium]
MRERGASIDPSRCVLCGQENHCAIAADPHAATCWCFTERVPAELRIRIPDELRNRACVCRRCITLNRRGRHTVGAVLIAALLDRIRPHR